MKVSTSIEISSTPQQIWAVLVDFDDYPTWNPVIVAAKGLAQPDKKLDITVKFAPTDAPQRFATTVGCPSDQSHSSVCPAQSNRVRLHRLRRSELVLHIAVVEAAMYVTFKFAESIDCTALLTLCPVAQY